MFCEALPGVQGILLGDQKGWSELSPQTSHPGEDKRVRAVHDEGERGQADQDFIHG